MSCIPVPASGLMPFPPPFRIDRAGLLPALPSNVRDLRYQTEIRVRVSSIQVARGPSVPSAPSYESRNWVVSVHPEGKRYAHSRQTFTVVTEADVAKPGVVDRLSSWCSLICDVAQENDVQIPENSDLYLALNCGTCSYYFANHSHRTVFWLSSVDAGSVGLPESFSDGHLRYALEENYWIHVELFPTILASQYFESALNELQAILLHARADALTSDVPTFPYTPEESSRFIEILQRGKEHASDPNVITFTARLRAVVANHRFITHFGEDHCRMSSQHSILEAPEVKRSFILGVISKLLFDLPNERRTQLEGLWVDELAYTYTWRKHVSETVEDLQQKMIWNFALLLANVLMLQMAIFPTLIKLSALFCTLGVGITFILSQEQRKFLGTNSATAAAYLDDRNTAYGFQPTAIVHSLPHAFFLWALLLFTIQGFWLVAADMPLLVVVPAGLVVLAACIGLRRALQPPSKVFEYDTAPDSESPEITPQDRKDNDIPGLMV